MTTDFENTINGYPSSRLNYWEVSKFQLLYLFSDYNKRDTWQEQMYYRNYFITFCVNVQPLWTVLEDQILDNGNVRKDEFF